MAVKLQKQANDHRPEDGIWGDCHRTAYAMALGLDRDTVPHFMDCGVSWEKANDDTRKWLSTIGLNEITFPVTGGSPRDVLDSWKVFAPDVPLVLGGMSRTGVGHSVCVFNGEIFDPSTKDSGIIGPMEDGYYWLTFFVPIRPATLTLKGE